LLASAKDCSIGGIAVALGKMSVISGLGFKGATRFGVNNFSESLSRVIVEVAPDKEQEFLNFCPSFALKVVKIGEVTADSFELDDIKTSSEELNELYFESFKKIVEQDL